MPLYFITGVAGTGKTTVKEEIERRGYTAYDSDTGNMTCWVNKSSGKKSIQPTDISQRTKDWYDQHDWNVDVDRIVELAKRAEKEVIFLCGSISNEADVLQYFDKIFCLITDEQTLVNRIKNRTNNKFGQAPDELRNILRWRSGSEKWYSDMGGTIIDSTQPVREIVDKIFSYITTSAELLDKE